MFVSDALGVNKEGHLTIGGVDVLSLTKEYGTPLYIMDEDNIRKNCRDYKNAMESNFGDKGVVAFASKAFCTSYMYKILMQEGLSADIVSGGELYTALHAGFPAERLYFHGNNKTQEELKMALEHGVGRIMVDNSEELHALDKLAGEMGKKPSIMFRIKPGIDAHTHEAIMTGQIDSKFGVALENGEAFSIVKEVLALKNLKLAGVHCHIGSQIFDNEPFMEAAKVMMTFVKKVKDELSYEIEEINLGGGFGIQYTEKDDPKTPEHNIEATAKALNEVCAQLSLKLPKIIIEPGRAIVAPAGITAYTVGAVKEIKDVRTYVSVDGGMADNPRYALYESKYTLLSAKNPTDKADFKCTVAGKCCESGDLIAKDAYIQPVKAGDVLCVLATGAYNYSMASHYNRLPKLPVVMVSEGKSKVVVKRETYEDLVRNDVL